MSSRGFSNLFLLCSSVLFLVILLEYSRPAMGKESECRYLRKFLDPCSNPKILQPSPVCNELCLQVANKGSCQAGKCRCYGCKPGIIAGQGIKPGLLES